MDKLFIETKIITTDTGELKGLAWPFGKPDRLGDWIEPGAFKAAAFPLPMLFGHDINDPVGTWQAGEEKADGFHITGKLLVDDVARAREVKALVGSGADPVDAITQATLHSGRARAPPPLCEGALWIRPCRLI